MNRTVFFALPVSLTILLLMACGGSPQPRNNTAGTPPAKKLSSGVEVYQEWCVTCHGKNGEGSVGPNLTDAYWIHGNTKEDLMRVTREGVPDKGMIPYKNLLQEAEIENVVEYILTLQGSNPEGAKRPEGKLVE